MNSTYNNKNILPNEIVEEIINYRLSYIHTQKFKNTLLNLPLYCIFFKINYINKIYKIDRNYSDDFLDTIMNLTTYDERLNMIKVLNLCHCCSRHTKNKPSLDDFENGFVPEYSVRYQNIHQCNCRCRSFCRDLCRAQNDEILEI
jgi:hypothetical protein